MHEDKIIGSFRKWKFVLLSTILFILLSTLCFLIFNQAIKDQRNENFERLEITGNVTYEDFKKLILHHVNSLEDLRDRIVESNGGFKIYLESDTKRIISQCQAIKFIEFIDSTGIINFIAPLDANQEVLNLDIRDLDYRYPSWRVNSKDTLINITSWLDLTQDGKAFLIDVPVYYDDRFQGTISAGMDFKKDFDNISSKQFLFSVLVKDQLGKTFYTYNNPTPEIYKENQIYKRKLSPLSNKSGEWTFEFMFYSENPLKATASQNLILILGIFLSFLIAVLAYFFMLANIQSSRYMDMNQKLNGLNEELKRERIKAEDASRAKTQFLSNMSHEIRTPLSAILSISEILEGKKLLASEKEFLRLMKNSSRLLLNLVNNILHIDKIESGKVELSQDMFSPFNTLRKIVEIYARATTNKGIEMITNFDSIKNPRKVLGDLSRTEQIFTNLLSNATKFTEIGKITIIYNENEYDETLKINFKVSDTGVGIDPSQIKIIFERFEQLDFGSTKKYQGSGLGLAITKTLVELMNGSISLESKIDVGSTFVVSLDFPIIKDQDEIIKLGYCQDLGHLEVLIVDDNILNQKILEKILSKCKIKPHLSKDGDDALFKCVSNHYDLIFMDVHMPGKDGFEIVQILRDMGNNAVILGFSADVTQEAIERGIKSGMNDYLTKPIEQKTLFAFLNKYFS